MRIHKEMLCWVSIRNMAALITIEGKLHITTRKANWELPTSAIPKVADLAEASSRLVQDPAKVEQAQPLVNSILTRHPIHRMPKTNNQLKETQEANNTSISISSRTRNVIAFIFKSMVASVN